MEDIRSRLDELEKLKPKVKKIQQDLKNLKALLIEALGLMSPNQSPCRDDAMFTKKPLLGNSCASCDKDIFNLIGQAVEFTPWQKFPNRDLTEKITKG